MESSEINSENYFSSVKLLGDKVLLESMTEVFRGYGKAGWCYEGGEYVCTVFGF